MLLSVALGFLQSATNWQVRPSERYQVNKLSRATLRWVLLASVLLPASTSCAQETNANEYRAKANFLAAFPNFIEWPPEAFATEHASLLICVLGDFSFGTSLAETTRGASIRGRKVEVRWKRKEQELRTCQILFISRSEARGYGKILKVLQGTSVLTVGETPDFLASGGVIEFSVAETELKFDVNLSAANEVRLRISSNMLALARHVITKAQTVKN